MPAPAKANARKPHANFDEQTKAVAWDELARLLIRGANLKEAAKELGFGYTTVQSWSRTKEFRTKLLRTRQQLLNPPKEATAMAVLGDIRAELKTMAEEAVRHMWALMKTSEDERVQLKAAQELADRSPETQKTKNVHVGGGVLLFKAEDLVLMAQTANEIREDLEFGHHVAPAELNESVALPIEIQAEPFEENS